MLYYNPWRFHLWDPRRVQR